jgi:hypothetical protein
MFALDVIGLGLESRYGGKLILVYLNQPSFAKEIMVEFKNENKNLN